MIKEYTPIDTVELEMALLDLISEHDQLVGNIQGYLNTGYTDVNDALLNNSLKRRSDAVDKIRDNAAWKAVTERV